MKFHRFSSVFRYTLGAGRCAFALVVCLLVPLSATGQVNPVPFVNQPLVPAASRALSLSISRRVMPTLRPPPHTCSSCHEGVVST